MNWVSRYNCPKFFSLVFFVTLFGICAVRADAVESPIAVKNPSPSRTWTSQGNTTYYVDSDRGSDSADGLSPAQAWRTLAKINSGTFAPGDKIHLHAGSVWTDYLSPGGSGSATAPIIVDSYGPGKRPKINAQGRWLATVYLFNASYVTLHNLDIANQAAAPIPKLAGVRVVEHNFGDADGIVLSHLSVHDVTGSDVKDEGGGAGIDCSCGGGDVPTRFNGLTIENCHIVRTDRNGITLGGNWGRNDWYPSLHVVIEHNLLEDVGGDGIVPIACDGALVQYNVLHGGRMRALDYAAGIWPWSCDNTIVQFNEVSGMKGTNDGEGYDSDYNCRNTIIQYNYSHDNDGGFLLICDDGTQSLPYNIGNIGTVVRYNVSIDDGLHTFHLAGPCSNTRIYNNTIYIGPRSASLLAASDSWGGLQAGTTFSNNVFFGARHVGFSIEGSQNFTFNNNAFWGNFTSHPPDPTAILSNPKLHMPGKVSPSSYKPNTGSPLLNAGVPIPDNGGRDYSGKSVPTTIPPTIGAFQQ